MPGLPRAPPFAKAYRVKAALDRGRRHQLVRYAAKLLLLAMDPKCQPQPSECGRIRRAIGEVTVLPGRKRTITVSTRRKSRT